ADDGDELRICRGGLPRAEALDDGAVAAEFDLEVDRLLTARRAADEWRVEGDGLPAEDDVVGVLCDEHVAARSVGPEVVPDARDHRLPVQALRGTVGVESGGAVAVARNSGEVERAVGGDVNARVVDAEEREREGQRDVLLERVVAVE